MALFAIGCARGENTGDIPPGGGGVGTVTGMVKGLEGQPVEGVLVRGTSVGHSEESEVTSGPDGQFTFHSVPAGRFAYRIVWREFTLKEGDIKVPAGGTTTLSDTLVPIRQSIPLP